jgi:hypothetical protein
MLNQVLIYSGSFMLLFWGVAHLFATRSVVAGFGLLSPDNRRIITMEWIIEGLSLMFIAAVVAVSTAIDQTSVVSGAVYWLSFAMLNILTIVSLFTGFKVNVLPFKLCPAIFTVASVLIVLGGTM